MSSLFEFHSVMSFLSARLGAPDRTSALLRCSEPTDDELRAGRGVKCVHRAALWDNTMLHSLQSLSLETESSQTSLRP